MNEFAIMLNPNSEYRNHVASKLIGSKEETQPSCESKEDQSRYRLPYRHNKCCLVVIIQSVYLTASASHRLAGAHSPRLFLSNVSSKVSADD